MVERLRLLPGLEELKELTGERSLDIFAWTAAPANEQKKMDLEMKKKL